MLLFVVIINYNKYGCNLLIDYNHVWLPDTYLNQSTCEEKGFIWQDVDHCFEDYSYPELCEDADHDWIVVEYLNNVSCFICTNDIKTCISKTGKEDG